MDEVVVHDLRIEYRYDLYGANCALRRSWDEPSQTLELGSWKTRYPGRNWAEECLFEWYFFFFFLQPKLTPLLPHFFLFVWTQTKKPSQCCPENAWHHLLLNRENWWKPSIVCYILLSNRGFKSLILWKTLRTVCKVKTLK